MILAIILAFLFVFASHVYTEAFFVQRAHLEIGRAIGYDLNQIIQLNSLSSYQGVGFAKIFRWIILIVMFYFYGWKMPVGLYILEFLYITFRPIPEWHYQEVMQWFGVVVSQDKSLGSLYVKAQNILRSKGINV